MSVTLNRMRCFEDVLHQAGWGYYNKFVLFFSILCAFSCSVTLTANSFVLPVAACDLGMRKIDVIWINAALPLGLGVGVLTMGIFSDIVSRKSVVSLSLIIIFISSFACGFCCEPIMLLMSTFMVGVGASGTFAYSKVNLSEILPMKHRGYYLALLDIFWVFGFLIASSINWVARSKVPTDYGEHYTSWRMLYTFACVISITCICLHGMLQPSPRILLATSRKQEAYLVLKYIFSINNSDHSDNYKVLPVELENLIYDLEIDREYLNTCKDQCILSRYKLWKIAKKMTERISFILIFGISIAKTCLFSGYGMANIWLVKSLHINTSDCYYTSLQFSHLIDEDSMTNCRYLIPVTVFRDFILIGSCGFIALILFSLIVDKCGRHQPISLSLIFCGLSSANFIFIRGYSYRYVLAAIYMTGFAISNAALDIILLENLPTCIRSTGLGITIFVPNCAAVIFHLFFANNCTYYYYIIGAFTTAIGVASYFLPDRKRRPMRE